MRRRLLLLGVLVVVGGLLVAEVSGRLYTSDAATSGAFSQGGGVGAGGGALAAAGRQLFLEGCASCHGADARGIAGRGPSLHGVGARSADFYLRTHRMPLDNPQDEPVRHSDSFYSHRQIAALVAYVASLGGPPVPQVHAERGDLARGQALFTDNCAGCHQVVGRGGMVPGAVVPDLQSSTPVDVAEAIGVGPYVMPRFTHLSAQDVDDIARYVQETKDPQDRGGWGLGHIGPIPEGMVTFLLAMALLLLGIRVIGERTTP